MIHRDSLLGRRSVWRHGGLRGRRPTPVLLILSGAWIALLGCSGDTTGPVPLPAQQTFWAVRLNYHAVNLALRPPYDTVRLTTAVVNATGTPLAGVDSTVHYSSADSSVTVDATGLVTAHSTTNGTTLIASLTQRGVSNKDTVVIRVTSTPFAAPLNAFSIQPRPDGLDSAKIPVDPFDALYTVSTVLPVYATIATGSAATDTICNVNSCAPLVSFATSDTAVATIDAFGNITPKYPGRVTLYASTYAYGVFRQDSLPFTIGYLIFYALPVQTTYQGSRIISSRFVNDSVVLGTGGVLDFYDLRTSDGGTMGETTYTVIFNPSVGIIGPLGGQSGDSVITNDSVVVVCDTCSDGGNDGARTFTRPGKYTFQSSSFLNRGIVIISSGP